ncbi:MAG: ATP-binding cassette domain-containing protein [Methanomassiliicoccus sp.]|nr:ATP-binding cassette domain-containing protein [Methanomassiliicoccus sp.]
MSKPLVEMCRASVVKGRSVILRDVDLRIEQGERIAILGPNGSGKSSLIKLMLGEFRHDTSGEGSFVRIRGEEHFSLFDVRMAFGLVSGDLQHDFRRSMTVTEVVLSGFFGSIGTNRSQKLTEEMEEKAMVALSQVGSGHLSSRTMATLSTGEARRVLMARALVNEPEALILDEPMNSLDLTGKHIVREAMRSLAQSGRTLVLVTHDPSDIIPEIRRVILMKDGQVFRDGGITELEERNLTELYGVSVRMTKIDDRYFAWS